MARMWLVDIVMRLTLPYVFVFHYFGAGVRADIPSPCIPRKYVENSFVCVCNATDCPEPGRLAPLDILDDFLFVVSSRDKFRFFPGQGLFKPFNLAEMVRETPDKTSATCPHRGAPKTLGFTHTSPNVKDPGNATLIVNKTELYQEILGFGGAMTDAAALTIKTLPEAAQKLLIRSYFSDDGIGYNIARVNMGGCDFSARGYTLDDYPGDVNLSRFALADEDLNYKIPLLRQAKSLRNDSLFVFASPWTAPAWMKTNNDLIGMGSLKTEYYQLWADYYLRFAEAYKKENVSLWGVTTQNEPVDGNIPGFTFNCMGWTGETQREWVKNNLGPTLRKAGYGDVKIMIFDEQRMFMPKWPRDILKDPEAAQYVSGIAVHWYTDFIAPPVLLDLTHAEFPDYWILSTEACVGFTANSPHQVPLGDWGQAQSYATDIIQNLNHWVVGWVDWNLVLNLGGGPNWKANFVAAPIVVNASSGEFYKNPTYYAMGHFSKFIPRGSVRIGLTIQAADEMKKTLQATAFKTPEDTIVLVAINTDEEPAYMSIQEDKRYINFHLHGKAIATFVWKYT
ncbi:unnamed protein product [Darwinula stevensoni]|uniref:Glucosylceramidase n=1 Tax=Darwinula stevensoni TaxID=69355 RepID=A0A7R9A769_9CRUS|nr:unnamed protein product [Darwinula stevensoni]CAG0890468.1 unnamed protein product [Darwinula stevensoni]